jgi:hypothetical protein
VSATPGSTVPSTQKSGALHAPPPDVQLHPTPQDESTTVESTGGLESTGGATVSIGPTASPGGRPESMTGGIDASGAIIMFEGMHCCDVGSQTSGAAQLVGVQMGTHCWVAVSQTWFGGHAQAADDSHRNASTLPGTMASQPPPTPSSSATVASPTASGTEDAHPARAFEADCVI